MGAASGKVQVNEQPEVGPKGEGVGTNESNLHEKSRGSRLEKSLMKKLLETTNHTNKHEKGRGKNRHKEV
jgi:hypothetical protein